MGNMHLTFDELVMKYHAHMGIPVLVNKECLSLMTGRISVVCQV
jgi:hypothetical protein